MGNIVWIGKGTPHSECIQMSNGITDVFINVLVLSGREVIL